MENLLRDINELITSAGSRRLGPLEAECRHFSSMCAAIADRLDEAGFGDCLAISSYYFRNMPLCAQSGDLYKKLHDEIRDALLAEQKKRYGSTFEELRSSAKKADERIDLKVVEVDQTGLLKEHDIQENSAASFLGEISQHSHYLILVDTLSRATIDVLGACLHVPSIVFLRHISGGGFIQHQISDIGCLGENCPNSCDHTSELRRREVYIAMQATQGTGYSFTWRWISELNQEGYKQERRALRSCKGFERSAAERIVPNYERPGNEDGRPGYVMSRVYRSHHLLDNYRRQGIWLLHPILQCEVLISYRDLDHRRGRKDDCFPMPREW